MALSRFLVRLRKETAAIESRPLAEWDVEPLYQLGTAETLHRLLTEECGAAVADTNTVVTRGLGIRLFCCIAIYSTCPFMHSELSISQIHLSEFGFFWAGQSKDH